MTRICQKELMPTMKIEALTERYQTRRKTALNRVLVEPGLMTPRSGRSPSRRSWSISKRSCSGFLADERLCPGRALDVPDPEFNDDLTCERNER
jgi:hypothetical protein